MSLLDYFTQNSCKSLKTTIVNFAGFDFVFLMVFICIFFFVAKFISYVFLGIKKIALGSW